MLTAQVKLPIMSVRNLDSSKFNHNGPPCTPPSLSTTGSISRPDAFQAFRLAFPGAYQELVLSGYEYVGDDVMGLCCENATVFLELCPDKGSARGWVYDATAEQFVGMTFVVTGPLDQALARVRKLAESTHAEDQLSGTASRGRPQTLDTTHTA